MLVSNERISLYRDSHKDFIHFYKKFGETCLCNDTPKLTHLLMHVINQTNDDFFIDSFKVRLKVVFFYIGNQYKPILVGNTSMGKEKYDTLQKLLLVFKYNDFNWKTCPN